MDGLSNKYARLLHMNLYAGFNSDSSIDLQVCQQPDGNPWVLGQGSCGIVYKVCHRALLEAASPGLIAPRLCLLHVLCRGLNDIDQ